MIPAFPGDPGGSPSSSCSYGGRHQRLFHDASQSAQTAITKPMEFFGIREASLIRFFSFAAQVFPIPAQPVVSHPVFAVLPRRTGSAPIGGSANAYIALA
ncbi:hypothetical protein D3C81_571250 [compost metagenome]